MKAPRELWVLLGLTTLALILSGIGPKDRITWWLEVAPVLIAAPLMIGTFRRFPLTSLLYQLVFVHALVLILGAHYTYAHVPLGFWVQDALDLGRNHYDRLGHFFQGFTPAILARELLLRLTPLRRGGWLFYLVLACCLSFSAFYELIEWWAAVFGGDASHEFLGTQGDIWDTQWDMFLCLIGAALALVLLARTHDRQLAQL